jgi:adenylate kinase
MGLRRVIVISGTPGTGKTALAKLLSNVIGADYLSLSQYVKEHRFHRGVDRKRRTKIVDLARARTSLQRRFAETKGWIVVDSHIPEGIALKRFVRLAVVLRCHPRILERRLRKKRWSPSKIRENVLAEILDSCLLAAINYYGTRMVIQIDTSKKNPLACVDAVQSALTGKHTRRQTKIDWLSALEKDGSLDRFLR